MHFINKCEHLCKSRRFGTFEKKKKSINSFICTCTMTKGYSILFASEVNLAVYLASSL